MAWKRKDSCGIQPTQESIEKTFRLFTDFTILGSQATTECIENTLPFFVRWWSGHFTIFLIFKTQLFVLIIFGNQFNSCSIASTFLNSIHQSNSSSNAPCWSSWQDPTTPQGWACWEGATLFGRNKKKKEQLTPWLKTPLQLWMSSSMVSTVQILLAS